jgi:hypothetical protein
MRTSNTRAGKFISTVGKIVMALVFISMIGGTFITPAFGKDNRRQGHQDRYRYEHGRRVYYYPSRAYYPVPIYVPPPVIYDPYPYQSPGISIIVPIRIR